MVLGPSGGSAEEDKILVVIRDNASVHIKLIFSIQLWDRGILRYVCFLAEDVWYVGID